MAEAFNLAIQRRAYNAILKLRSDEVEYINSVISTKNGLRVEEAYHKLTGMLVEPVIARYWIDCGHVDLKKPSPSNPFVSLYYIKG